MRNNLSYCQGEEELSEKTTRYSSVNTIFIRRGECQAQRLQNQSVSTEVVCRLRLSRSFRPCATGGPPWESCLMARADVLSGVGQTPESTWCLLGINAGVHPGRPRGMRHHLPHTRGMGGRMLLLLLPLRAFGHGGTCKLIDGGIPAGALMDPIAAGVHHPRHLAIARNIFVVVPSVPLCISLGGHGHAADLQHRRHVPLRHLDPVRVNLLPDNSRQVRPDHGRRDPLPPRRPGPVGKSRGVHHRHVVQLIACQVLGAALHRLVPGRRENAGHRQQFRQMFRVIPFVEFLVVLGVDIDVHQKNPSAFVCHVSVPLCRVSFPSCCLVACAPALTPEAHARRAQAGQSSGERARLRGRLLEETARYGCPLSDRTATCHRPATLCKAVSCTPGCWTSVETRRAPMCMGRLSHALMPHTTLGFCRRPSGSFGTKNNDVNKLSHTVTCSDNNSSRYHPSVYRPFPTV